MRGTIVGLGLLALCAAPAAAQVKPPLSLPMEHQLRNSPLTLKSMEIPLLPKKPAAGLKAAAPLPGPWQQVANQPANFIPTNPLLLHDGSVIIHNAGGGGDWQKWFKLKPDLNGSYATGNWSSIAPLPAGYGPMFFASAVLPDGRVIINGGEYNFNALVWTNLSAIYSPSTNSWSMVAPPAGWLHIGDAQSAVLANGKYMLADAVTTQQAILDPVTLTWTTTGAGKFDINDEEGWTLLWSGKLLTVDTYVSTTIPCGMNTESYDPATGLWSSAGSLPFVLADCFGLTFEMGPQPLRYDGKVVAFGALTTAFPDRTAIYDGASWVAGPNIPNGDTLADAPAAVMPNGNILFAAGPGFDNLPTRFYEMDQANNIVQVAGNADDAGTTGFQWNFVLLPSGQVLATDFNNVWIYTPAGAPQNSWRPVVQYAPSFVVTGNQYQSLGAQYNGLTQGSFFGDDQQSATNWPVVRLTNLATGHVFYADTRGQPFNTYGISPGLNNQIFWTPPASAEPGSSTFEVVANGIPSVPRPIQVRRGVVIQSGP